MKLLIKTSSNPYRLPRFRGYFATCAFIFFLLSHPAISQPSISQEVITIATPFELDKDKSKGIWALFNEAYGELGYEIEIINYPANRAWSMTNQGITSAHLGGISTIGDKFENLIRVPAPLIHFELAIYAKKGTLKGNNPITWETIKPYSIAYMRGLVVMEANLENDEQVEVTELNQLIPLLLKDRVELIAGSKDLIDGYFLASGVDSNEFEFHTLQPVSTFHYLNKQHSGLVEPLANVFKEMRSDGRLDVFQSEILAQLARIAQATVRSQ